MYALSILAGLALLYWGADRMVLGAAATGRNLGISPMVIGLTILGFVTSIPEILVSATAALTGAPFIAIGNAIGSNITNLGLVAGVAALVAPLSVRSATLRRELIAMTGISCLPVVLFFNDRLDRLDGIILILALLGFLYWIVRLASRTHGQDAIEAEYATEIPRDVRQATAVLWILAGLILLVAGSNALVWGSENLARSIGISDLVIGLTLVAVGTSLPELAVSVVAARKGEHGLALGNIIGSNAFNMLAVIGVAALIAPADLDPDILRIHLPVMLLFTFVFFSMTYNRRDTVQIRRGGGALLLAGFLAYYGYLLTRAA